MSGDLSPEELVREQLDNEFQAWWKIAEDANPGMWKVKEAYMAGRESQARKIAELQHAAREAIDAMSGGAYGIAAVTLSAALDGIK